MFAEPSSTVRTPVRPGSTVDKHVTFQISGSWETFVTQAALVRFILEKSELLANRTEENGER